LDAQYVILSARQGMLVEELQQIAIAFTGRRRRSANDAMRRFSTLSIYFTYCSVLHSLDIAD